MKYLINKKQFQDTIIHYLDSMCGDLEEYRTDKYPDSIFFVKDGKTFMEQDLEEKDLWIESTIWEDLREIFSLTDKQIELFIKKWVAEKYNIKGYSPVDARPMSMKIFN